MGYLSGIIDRGRISIMSDIKIRTGRKYSATVIPNVFIDRYMAGANGLQIKVYLYVLRCLSGSNVDFTISSAADTCGVP